MQTGAAMRKPADIRLPEPRTSGGKTLMEAIKRRRSCRKYGEKPLSLQELSEVLWSAFGFTRALKGTGIHTPGSHSAPSAHNWQEIDVYVATADGLYLYDAAKNELQGVLLEDIRHLTAHKKQPFVLEAPVILIYVADLDRMHDASEWDRGVFPWVDTSFIAENVYLYCASEGLGTVVRAMFDRPPLEAAMRLRFGQMVTFSQPVGYAG